MSWSGTVTCSHCFQRGHNKRKCPSLTAQIKSQYEGNMLAAAIFLAYLLLYILKNVR